MMMMMSDDDDTFSGSMSLIQQYRTLFCDGSIRKQSRKYYMTT